MNVFFCKTELVVWESAKSQSMNVDDQGCVGNYQHVDANVKFLATDEIRIVNVALDDVSLRPDILVTVDIAAAQNPRRVPPLTDLTEFVDQKYSFALWFSNGLHDPQRFGVFFKFFQKHSVFSKSTHQSYDIINERQHLSLFNPRQFSTVVEQMWLQRNRISLLLRCRTSVPCAFWCDWYSSITNLSVWAFIEEMSGRGMDTQFTS